VPAPKALEQHVRGRTFRARRHAELLLGRRLPWPELAELQDRYREARGELDQRAVAVEFERAVRERSSTERWPFDVVMYLQCGPGYAQDKWCQRDDGTFDPELWLELQRAWDDWNDAHGLKWCARNIPHAIGTHILEIARQLGEEAHESDLSALQDRRAELLERFNKKNARRRIPDPPGWDRLSRAHR
jgi:hypothetical protein